MNDLDRGATKRGKTYKQRFYSQDEDGLTFRWRMEQKGRGPDFVPGGVADMNLVTFKAWYLGQSRR